jgi:hypothetical protein
MVFNKLLSSDGRLIIWLSHATSQYDYGRHLLIRLQLIRMSDNLDRNMKNALHSCRSITNVRTVKAILIKERQHRSIQTKLETVSSNLQSYVQKQVQLLSLLSVEKHIVFL